MGTAAMTAKVFAAMGNDRRSAIHHVHGAQPTVSTSVWPTRCQNGADGGNRVLGLRTGLPPEVVR